jgi:hypothetical protein
MVLLCFLVPGANRPGSSFAIAFASQPVGLRPNVNVGKGMKKSEYVQEPQDHGDHYDAIQDRLDRPLHRDEAIDQPEQNTYYDQNHY